MSLVLLLAQPAWPAGVGSYEQLPLERRREMQREVRVIIALLENHHWSGRSFVELEPGELLDAYMNVLDPLHAVFLAGDQKYLQRRFGKTMKASYLLAGDLYPAFEIHDIFRERWKARADWLRQRLRQPFDLARADSIDPVHPLASYGASAEEVDSVWERLVSAWLIEGQLRGRTADEALSAVVRAIDRWDRRLAVAEVESIGEAFLNAVLGLHDPHSGYHSWEAMLDLEVEMSGSIVGIGAEFKRVGKEVIVTELTPGGSAEACGEMRPGDLLVAVGADPTTQVPVRGLRLSEIVRTLRGDVGTHVHVTVRRPGASSDTVVRLERRRSAIASERAGGFVYELGAPESPARVGVIRLPSFYGETGGDGVVATSSADDVAELLRKFIAQGVSGVVLDVRDNPGGRTDEAVRIAGHFIDTGPVMFLTSGEGGIGTVPRHESDTQPGMLWSGPLAVLTSARSASASELVAGALQAYGRAIVVGAERTFGKGTSQIVVPVREAARQYGITEGEHFGMVRITSQKFYLPDGSSTQMRGVAADVVIPSGAGAAESTESTMPGALPWSSLPVPGFANARAVAVPSGVGLTLEQREWVLAESVARRAGGREFGWHQRRLDYRSARWGGGPVSLDLQQRRAAQAELEARRRALSVERRALAAELDHPWRSVELDVVAAQIVAPVDSESSIATGAVYARGVFRVRDAEGTRWRELRIDAADFDLLSEERDELAAALSGAFGCEIDPVELGAACLAASEEEYDKSGVFERRIAQMAGVAPDSAELRAGLAAMFSRIVQLDPWLVDRPVPLDIALREAMRVLMDWRSAISSSPAAARAANP